MSVRRYRRAPSYAPMARWLASQAAKHAFRYATTDSKSSYKVPVRNMEGKKIKSKSSRKKETQKLKQDVKSLKMGLRSLKCDQEQSLGLLTYRRVAYDNVTSAINAQGSVSVGINTLAQMQAVLGKLLYYDPSNPATLITANYETGTYSRDVCFKSIYGKIKATNNYQVPCECTIYLCEPVSETSSSPVTIWDSAVSDNPGSGYVTSRNNVNVYPSDFETFTKIWKSRRVGCKILKPGQSMTASTEIKNLDYDPAVADIKTDQYQKLNKNRAWLIIVKGLTAHDTTLDQQGIAAAGVDIEYHTIYKVRYDAGVNISYVFSDNQGDTFTNGAVMSLQPVADNLAYSQS